MVVAGEQSRKTIPDPSVSGINLGQVEILMPSPDRIYTQFNIFEAEIPACPDAG
jgi:hypothetical protein